MATIKMKRFFTLMAGISVISACQTISTDSGTPNSIALNSLVESQRINQQISSEQQISTDQALSSLSIENTPTPKATEDRFDVSVKDTDINSFLLGLVDSTQFNLIISPDIKLNISLQLKNVTVSEVLLALSKIYPINIQQNDNLFLVSSAEASTAVYTVDYLNIKRKGDSKTSVAGQSVSGQQSDKNQSSGSKGGSSSRSGSNNNIQQANSSNVETKSETDFWSELSKSLNLIVKDEPKASVVVSPHAGLVVVRSLPQTHELIRTFLSRTQKSLNRQVIIEAKIIEVSLNDGFQSGVDWSKIGTTSNNTYTLGQQGQVLNQTSADSPLNGMFSLLYEGNSFAAAINLLKSQGDVQVLSSPRVSTVNNQKAIIKVGSDEFFVTDVSTTTVTGTSTATTPDVTLTPFFSGISLDVTPQVNKEGDIVLHIHPIVSEVDDQRKTLTLGEDEFVLPLAITNVRESDSIVRTRNGRVVVIGGLMQNSVNENVTSTPLLGDIPFLGGLFKQTRQSQSKSELVILLKAHLVDIHQTDSELNELNSRFSNF